MSDDLRTIAAEYCEYAATHTGDGAVHWQPYSKALVHRFMLAVCDAIAALEAELQPEGPVALQQARARVDELERELLEAREGMYYGEMPV